MLMCYLLWYDKLLKKLIVFNLELNKLLSLLRGKLSYIFMCLNKLKLIIY